MYARWPTPVDHLLSDFSLPPGFLGRARRTGVYRRRTKSHANLPITALSPRYTTPLLYYLPATIPIYCQCAHRSASAPSGFPLTTDFPQTFPRAISTAFPPSLPSLFSPCSPHPPRTHALSADMRILREPALLRCIGIIATGNGDNNNGSLYRVR